MKKIGIGLAVMAIMMMVSLSVTGCSSREYSSREEAIYATRELPEFKRIVYYLSVKGSNDVLLPGDTFHISGSKFSYRAVHIVVYEDIRDSIKMVIWDERRPPRKIEVK